MVALVISVNVYRSVKTLRLQLDTIKRYVLCDHVVLLNCDVAFMRELKDERFEANVIVNPTFIPKARYTGSLTRGIVCNMRYALSNLEFDFFLVLSGRTVFYRELRLEDLKARQPRWPNRAARTTALSGPPPNESWHWPSFKKTELAKHYTRQGRKLHTTMHEGVCFYRTVVRNIVRFLGTHLDIARDLFSFPNCVEEFALQTIATIEVDRSLYYGFIYIGNGCYNECDVSDRSKYTKKIDFL